MTWYKTTEYPFNPLMGDKSEAGLRRDKANALQAVNSFLPEAMRFAKALEDWEE